MEEIASSIIQNERENTTLRRRKWSEVEVHGWVRIAIVGILFCYLFRAEVGSVVSLWISDANWSHGFLIPLFSLYLLNQRREAILNIRTKPNYLGLLLLVLWILFYFFNIVSPSGYAYFRSVSMIGSLAAIVLLLGGWALLKHAWLPVVFLIFAVPLPRRYYVAFTMPMRHLAATVATALLNLVPKVEATASGVVIDVLYHGERLDPALNVAEACSGMRLLMAFLALGVAMAFLHYRPVWQRLTLLSSTIPIAIFCNIVRVTVTGFLYVFVGPQYTQGIYHDALGLAMLPLAFAIYGFLAWFMSSLFIEEGDEVKPDIVVRSRRG